MSMHSRNNFMPPVVRARGEGILGGMGEYFSGAYELQGYGMPPFVDAYRSGSLGEQVSTMPRYSPIGEYFEGYGAFSMDQAKVYGIAAVVGAALGAGVGMIAKVKPAQAAAIGAVAAIAAPLIMVPIINAISPADAA